VKGKSRKANVRAGKGSGKGRQLKRRGGTRMQGKAREENERVG